METTELTEVKEIINDVRCIQTFRMLLAGAPTNMFAEKVQENIFTFDGSNFESVYFLNQKEHFEIYKIFVSTDNLYLKIGDITPQGIVSKIELNEDNKISIRFLENIQKEQMEILFTTEDGIEIKTGDKYHRVDVSNIHNLKCDFNCKASSEPEAYYNWKNKNWGNFRVFGNEDNTKFFLLINTPLLTVNEVLDTLGTRDFNDPIAQKLLSYAVNKAQTLQTLQQQYLHKLF